MGQTLWWVTRMLPSIIETSDGGYAVLGNTKSQDGDVSEKILLTEIGFSKLDQMEIFYGKKFMGDLGMTCHSYSN